MGDHYLAETIYCSFCGEPIPAETIAKRHYSTGTRPKHSFCNSEHGKAFRQQHNDYSRVSKMATGRSAAVAKSNQVNPRRRKVKNGTATETQD